MNNKGMFYTNVDDYETKEDMMNDFIALRMYDMAKDKEIERLKNELENVKAHYETEAEAKYYEFIDKHESKLQQRIDDAIEYIKTHNVIGTNKEYIPREFEYCCSLELLQKLKGDRNE